MADRSPLALQEDRKALADAVNAGQSLEAAATVSGASIIDLNSARMARVQNQPYASFQQYGGAAPEPREEQRATAAPAGLVDSFYKVCLRWKLTDDEMSALLSLPRGSVYLRLLLGGTVKPLTGDMRERMALVSAISFGLGELFRDDPTKEIAWITHAQPNLDNRSPLQVMLRGRLIEWYGLHYSLNELRGLA